MRKIIFTCSVPPGMSLRWQAGEERDICLDVTNSKPYPIIVTVQNYFISYKVDSDIFLPQSAENIEYDWGNC